MLAKYYPIAPALAHLEARGTIEDTRVNYTRNRRFEAVVQGETSDCHPHPGSPIRTRGQRLAANDSIFGSYPAPTSLLLARETPRTRTAHKGVTHLVLHTGV